MKLTKNKILKILKTNNQSYKNNKKNKYCDIFTCNNKFKKYNINNKSIKKIKKYKKKLNNLNKIKKYYRGGAPRDNLELLIKQLVSLIEQDQLEENKEVIKTKLMEAYNTLKGIKQSNEPEFKTSLENLNQKSLEIINHKGNINEDLKKQFDDVKKKHIDYEKIQIEYIIRPLTMLNNIKSIYYKKYQVEKSYKIDLYTIANKIGAQAFPQNKMDDFKTNFKAAKVKIEEQYPEEAKKENDDQQESIEQAAVQAAINNAVNSAQKELNNDAEKKIAEEAAVQAEINDAIYSAERELNEDAKKKLAEEAAVQAAINDAIDSAQRELNGDAEIEIPEQAALQVPIKPGEQKKIINPANNYPALSLLNNNRTPRFCTSYDDFKPEGRGLDSVGGSRSYFSTRKLDDPICSSSLLLKDPNYPIFDLVDLSKNPIYKVDGDNKLRITFQNISEELINNLVTLLCILITNLLNTSQNISQVTKDNLIEIIESVLFNSTKYDILLLQQFPNEDINIQELLKNFI